MRDMADTTPARTGLSRWERATEWPLTATAVLFLAVYAWEILDDLDGHARTVAESVLNAIWLVFVVDYVVRLVLAPDRPRWFFRHLLDLAAVALPMLRPLRLLRLASLIGVLQRHAGTALRGRITVYVIGSVLLFGFIGALAVLDAERDAPGATIVSFGDAVWWSLVTVTTVGYGDIAPITQTGRTIAVALMVGGVALVGIVSATLASWIVSAVADESAGPLSRGAATAKQVTELQEQVKALTAEVSRLAGLPAGVPEHYPDEGGPEATPRHR